MQELDLTPFKVEFEKGTDEINCGDIVLAHNGNNKLGLFLIVYIPEYEFFDAAALDNGDHAMIFEKDIHSLYRIPKFKY